ncbi:MULTISPECIES: WD40 repeat domain-containing protein [unclassified Oleiphilus]|uniref:WD40 repeat domain-containing protein n=2 Tax=Oleiphilus TaxID=141450 RepID=UPI0009ED2A97|nr:MULTISPECIES: hypothetical protein [unclassified Oleiphilus]
MFKKQTSTLLLSLALAACAEGPTSSKQLATQGLLSGELSPNGYLAVIGSVHHGGSFWNTKKKERLYDWNHKSGEYSSIRASAVSGDGKRAVTCQEKDLVLWDATNGKSLQFWQAADRIEAISLNQDGRRALLGLRDGTVNYFDLDRGMAIHSFKHNAPIRATDLSEDGAVGISAGDDNIAKIWNLKTGKEQYALSLNNQIKTAAISDSGKLAFTTSQREDALVWDTKTGKSKFKFKNRYINYTSADFSDDEKYLTLGTFQGVISKFNIKKGTEVKTWQAEPRQAYGGASSKAIIDVIDQKSNVIALTSDGMLEVFK